MEGISINIVTASFFYILIKKFYFYDGMLLLILSKLSLITTTVSLIEIGDKKTEKKRNEFVIFVYTTLQSLVVL